MNRLLLVLPALAFLTAAVSTAAAQKPKRDRYLITAEEISESRVTSAYEAIQRLRPQFLRQPRSTRLPGSFDSTYAAPPAPGIRLFVGDVPQHDIDVLKHIAATYVQEIRYYGPTEAGGRLGVMDGSAAVVVTLKIGPSGP